MDKFPFQSMGTQAVLKKLAFPRTFSLEESIRAADMVGVPHCRYEAYYNVSRKVMRGTLFGVSTVTDGDRRKEPDWPAPGPARAKNGDTVTQCYPFLFEGVGFGADVTAAVDEHGNVVFNCRVHTKYTTDEGAGVAKALGQGLLQLCDLPKPSQKFLVIRHVRLIRFLRELGIVPDFRERKPNHWHCGGWGTSGLSEWPAVTTEEEGRIFLPAVICLAKNLMAIVPTEPTKDFVLGWSEDDPPGVLKTHSVTAKEVEQVLADLVINAQNLLNEI